MGKGEPKDIDHAAFDRRKLTREQAVGMLFMLSLHFPVLYGVTFEFSNRKTVCRQGVALMGRRKILLYPVGMNEGTVIHECAHYLAGPVDGHGKLFKAEMRKLCAFWRQKQGF